MARRVTLPSAEDLFRPTQDTAAVEPADAGRPGEPGEPGEFRRGAVHVVPDQRAGASGRIRHDEKMTVYVTSEELLAIEQARLTLRRDHGLAVDRGRLTREALHLALEGLTADGGTSALVRRLVEET